MASKRLAVSEDNSEIGRLEVYCKELVFCSIDDQYSVTFRMDKETMDGIGIKQMSNLARITIIVDRTRFEFSKLREETL